MKIMSQTPKMPKVTMEDLRNQPKYQITEEQKKTPMGEIWARPLADVAQEQLDALNNGPCNPQLALSFENRSNIFLPGEQSVEIGYCAMPDGTGFVANRTFFPNATPEMINWWMNFYPLKDENASAWLPNAHLTSFVKDPYLHSDECGNSLATRSWNKEHYPTEGLTSLEESGVCCLRFYSPQEFGLDMHKVLISPSTVFLCASALFFGDSLIMFGEEKAKEIREKSPDAKVPFNLLIHAIRPVPGGCEMRSRFWVGKGLDNGKVIKTMPESMKPEMISWVMLRHTIQEMSNLASFLPEIYNKYEGKITPEMCK